MSYDVADDDWQAIVEVLEETIRLLNGKEVGPVKLSILEFSSVTAMLGLDDLADVGNQFETFLLETVAPGWDEEAAATLNFAIGALIEKMQTQQYGPEFIAGLGEVSLYLSFYEKEEPAPYSPPRTESQVTSTLVGVEPEMRVPDLDDEQELPPLDLPHAEMDSMPSSSLAPDEGLIGMKPSPQAHDTAGEVEFIEEPPGESILPEPPVQGDKLEEHISAPIDELPASESPTDVRPTDEALVDEFMADVALRDEVITVGAPAIEALDELPPTPLAEHILETEQRPSAPESGASGQAPTDKVEWYREILGLDPASRVFEFLVEELCSQGRWEEAVEDCRRGLVFHPRLVRARVLLGWALWRSGEPDEAERVLMEARREIEKNDVLYKVLAEISEIRGDADEAAYLWSIHRAFRSVEGQRPWLQLPIESMAASPPVRRKGAPLTGFLSALLQNYERKPVDMPTSPGLFSEEDRDTLKKLLNPGTIH